MLKGLQGEIEEVLNNISLSVNILRELYRAYDFCCANMELFFKVRPAARAGSSWGGAGLPSVPALEPVKTCKAHGLSRLPSSSPRKTRSQCPGNSLLPWPSPG